MFFLKNCDRTYGSQQLMELMQEENSIRDTEYNLQMIKCANEYEKTYKKDWLYQMLAQYPRNHFRKEDSMYVTWLVKMILDESLFMSILPCDRWATNDKDWKTNKATIESAGFKVCKSNGNADGHFECGKLSLKQVYLDDESTPIEMDEISCDSWHGIIEIGYQHLCKSMFSLHIGDSLLRLPYPIKGLDPCVILFDNINPAKIELFES
jgi:hypothetical protein